MRKQTAVRMVFALLLSGAATETWAQTVLGGVGWTSGWDDETALGKGMLISGGVARAVGPHVAIEGEVAWARHRRDSGYLAADGTPLLATARLAYVFQRPESRARAFASAGAGLVHSTGHLTTPTFLQGPGGLPVEGPSLQRDWSITQPAFEVGGGVSIQSGDRVAIRPELRWTSTRGQAASSTLEPPLWIIRAGVTLAWRVRRGR